MVGISLIVDEEIMVQGKPLRVTQRVSGRAQVCIQVYDCKTSFFHGRSSDRLFIPTRRMSRLLGAAFDVAVLPGT